MDVDQYAEWVSKRWLGSDPLQLRDKYIMGMGLPEEVAEAFEAMIMLSLKVGKLSGTLKKEERDNNVDRTRLMKELGDVGYYWVRICTAHGFKPSEILAANVEKIDGRLERGTLHGNGDDR